MNYSIKTCDEEGDHRYSLEVATAAPNDRALIVIQCNPSTARFERSDPTVGKVSNWALEHEFGRIRFLNLFAKRGSHVAPLRGYPYEELIGPRNDDVVRSACSGAGTIICAWGASLPVDQELYDLRLRELRSLLGSAQLFRVGALVNGRYPRHGRMWNRGHRDIQQLNWATLVGH